MTERTGNARPLPAATPGAMNDAPETSASTIPRPVSGLASDAIWRQDGRLPASRRSG